jgi:hypothetical protein
MLNTSAFVVALHENFGFLTSKDIEVIVKKFKMDDIENFISDIKNGDVRISRVRPDSIGHAMVYFADEFYGEDIERRELKILKNFEYKNIEHDIKFISSKCDIMFNTHVLYNDDKLILIAVNS